MTEKDEGPGRKQPSRSVANRWAATLLGHRQAGVQAAAHPPPQLAMLSQPDIFDGVVFAGTAVRYSLFYVEHLPQKKKSLSEPQ